ncbi:hypothetical protein [Velocimicrobium porci]|uniref:Uncharacterized protein n=1 Tax=Velocimicrobium porci TaxID=2606634 RepID=A0A6L5XVG9_9FIRM|nr:hypothetical protein [Velocimicrobium porci]MSS62795.1 hypothetical protein [Velocimicrobium porci]
MSYFNNPQTEEELKNQYRRLLIKYDYRSDKNIKIIEEIRREYNLLQMQIKRANGYRTPTEKIYDEVKAFTKEVGEAHRAEEQRINQLKNHTYTKAEIQSLIEKTKSCVDKIVYSIVKKQLVPYVSLHNVVARCDSEQICRWFNTHAVSAVPVNLHTEYDEVREKLEYALKSRSNDKKSQEAFMVQMEKMIGNHIALVFRKYEDELIDPIVIAEQDMRKYEEKRSSQKGYDFARIVFVGLWIVIVLYALFEGLTNKHVSMSTSLILIAISTVGVYLMYFLMIKIPRKVNQAFEKKTYAGIGNRKHNSRMSEKKQYQSDRAKNSLIQFITRFFG